MTKIEWTERTWNPIVGCSVVSPGCTNCYAMRMAARLEAMGLEHYRGLTQASKAGAVWTGKLALASDKTMAAPYHRKKPTTYFVNSMGDLFHENILDSWIDRVFCTIVLCPQHVFQVLTKRAERMRAYIEGAADRVKEKHHWARFDTDPGWPGWPLPNVWLGVSCEDQTRADERIPHLLAAPAAVRFISAEPMLGPINLLDVAKDGRGGNAIYSRSRHRLDWVIVGGESGPGARPMHPDWARNIRDQCAAAGISFFFKQWGEWRPAADEDERTGRAQIFGREGVATVMAVGKKAAGRLLDGRTWNEMPVIAMGGKG